ncbi:flavin-containing monooxygenase 5-like [Misgurnus anguillicaudatus]|uniref:flavin-containing monooxygenase 5-like n=1 Tax=Misgurnus anguillicaudatus TaxID=75329 RepID=UPI003CCF2F72
MDSQNGNRAYEDNFGLEFSYTQVLYSETPGLLTVLLRSMAKRVAVIGAGHAGLVSIKCCLDEGLEPVCFESSDDIGGLWRFKETHEAERTSIYRSLVVNTSKEMMCFSDFPMPDHFPNYMHNSLLLQYLRLYAKHFGLLKHIQLKTTVSSVRQRPDFSTSGQWDVVTVDRDGREEKHVFDGVLVCTGQYTQPNKPLSDFKGAILHSCDYRDPDLYLGKSVVIFGIGNSGVDIAVELRRVCEKKNLANMEAAGEQPISALEEFLQRLLARMDHQDKAIDNMRKAVHAMVAKVSELSQRSPHTTLPTAPPTPPASSSPPGGSSFPEPRLLIPEKYSGHIISTEGVRMDPEKVKAVVDWPSQESHKALQIFLGFANFYRRFIRNFSQLAAPLTALTSPSLTFGWSDATESAFATLKSCFVSAPILVTPDRSRQFIVEVDASEVGVGAVLSQRASSDERVHPCAYFSHRLSPAEDNYDIGNRELLAVKLALEEDICSEGKQCTSLGSVWGAVVVVARDVGSDQIGKLTESVEERQFHNCRVLDQRPIINNDLPGRILMGALVMTPNLQKIQDSTVVFDDGTAEEKIDAVILCTGYNYAFPFLPTSLKGNSSLYSYACPKEAVLQVNYIPYLDSMAKEVGVRPNIVWLLLSDPALGLRVLFGPLTPCQFRLRGPGHWSGARQAILTVWERVAKPMKTRPIPDPKSSSLLYWLGVAGGAAVIVIIMVKQKKIPHFLRISYIETALFGQK